MSYIHALAGDALGAVLGASLFPLGVRPGQSWPKGEVGGLAYCSAVLALVIEVSFLWPRRPRLHRGPDRRALGVRQEKPVLPPSTPGLPPLPPFRRGAAPRGDARRFEAVTRVKA